MPPGRCFLPGPTEVRPEVLDAMRQPMIAHRSPAFQALFARLQDALRPVFRTERPVYVATASATGLMEAAVRNTPPGPLLAVVHGAFGERFARIAEACGRPVQRLVAPPGQVVPLAAVDEALARRAFAAVSVVHVETSTGAMTDLQPLGALVRAHDTLLLVDSVTGVGGVPVETDTWGLDFVFTGSQKALALPPGLAFGVASARFRDRFMRATDRGLYFDLETYEAAAARCQVPTTPALPLLYAADAQGGAIAREGLAARWARHAAMARVTHAWVERVAAHTGMAFGILAQAGVRATTVTAVTLPLPLQGEGAVRALVRAVADRGYDIAGGYGSLADSTIRIGHLGEHTVEGLAGCLDAVADAIHHVIPG